jgi:hypothetical protein
MAWFSPVPVSFRLPGLALLVSITVHAVVLVGMPPRIAALEEPAAAFYSATLEARVAAAPPTPVPVAAATPRPRPPRRAARKPAPAPTPEIPSAALIGDEEAVPGAPAQEGELTPLNTVAEAPPEPAPEVVALAQPATPVPALEPPKFPVEALPPRISVSYKITSAFADGHAVYEWAREGDSYRITGEAEAEGFFTLFLEGRLRQESHGTVTAAGLKPERFTESRPNHPREGLEFDWDAGKITFDRGGNRDTRPLAVNTVDWLSMIFQLAHVPPAGESLEMQVFTQRKMYRFRLQVLGIEEIEVPMGTLRALHLRHDDPADDKEAIDVWLGVDHHYLPLKLRFPVARNRLMVEQVATGVTVRDAP